MKVIFTTDIKEYDNVNFFPQNLTIPPRIGEKVCVLDKWYDYFDEKKLSHRLKVVDVVWKDYHVCCVLSYD